MRFVPKDFFSEDITSDEEFDKLVIDLLYVEPPQSLVDTILSSVAKIPLPQRQAGLLYQEEDLISDHDGLIVLHDLIQPS